MSFRTSVRYSATGFDGSSSLPKTVTLSPSTPASLMSRLASSTFGSAFGSPYGQSSIFS